MINLSYDLHIHSCLSPCGDIHMTPANIAGMAFVKGLDVVALTDHNSCKNCAPFIKHCHEYGILAIAGVEVTTIEEVHVLCFFEMLKDALAFDLYLYNLLIKIPNSEEIFGAQIIYDHNDFPINKEKSLLLNSTNISLNNLYEIVKQFNGVMIPAHIDKEVNSIIANLGFVGEDNSFKCFEVKDLQEVERLKEENSYLKKCNVICNSDAHFLENINESVNFLSVKEKTIKAVLEAIEAVN